MIFMIVYPIIIVYPELRDDHLDDHMFLQLDRVSIIAAKFLGRPAATQVPLQLSGTSLQLAMGGTMGVAPEPLGDFNQGPSVADVATRPGGLTDAEKPLVAELAIMAMEELVQLAQCGEPLWVHGLEVMGFRETLNYDHYVHQFPQGIGPRPTSLKMEATRGTGHVMISPVNLVETLMDAVCLRVSFVVACCWLFLCC